jgi:glutaredoxin
MKITVYTITDCAFSKQEKEYLAGHGLPFEEKNLESNREFLTEMLTVGNNFAGTPVTKIEKDDASVVVLKGFTKEEFDKALGFVETHEAAAPAAAPSAPATPAIAPAPVAPEPVAPAPAPAPIADPAMQSVLNNLEQQAAAPVAPAAPSAPAAPTGAPTIPDPQFTS